MKKWTILLAVGLVFAMVLPALATDISVKGTYRVRGIYNKDQGIYDVPNVKDSANTDVLDHRLRMQVDFQVHDNLKVITRIDAWDGKHFNDQDGQNFLQLDKVYMEIISPIGFWRIGRNNAGNWGTKWAGDGGADQDNITYVLPMNNWYLGLKYVKKNEWDGTSLATGNYDYDQYIASITYRTETWEAGFLAAYYDDEGAGGLAGAAGFLAPGGDSTVEAYLYSPYVKATFGNLAVGAEYILADAEVDWDAIGAADLDVDSSSFFLEGTYTMGAFSFNLNYGWAEGDADALNGALGSPVYAGVTDADIFIPFADWTDIAGAGLLLFDNNQQFALGYNAGAGALLDRPVNKNAPNSYLGISTLFGGVSYQVTENIGVGLNFVYAEADDVPSGWDDDYGWEYDLSLSWDIMDNLNFTTILAYLDAGDFYKGSKYGAAGALARGDVYGAGVTPAAGTSIEDPLLWYNALTVSF